LSVVQQVRGEGRIGDGSGEDDLQEGGNDGGRIGKIQFGASTESSEGGLRKRKSQEVSKFTNRNGLGTLR